MLLKIQRAAVLTMLCLLAAGVQASSARPIVSGTVFEDRFALALRAHFTPAAGVVMKLYRDDGDRQPGRNDVLTDNATTNESGVYVLRAEGAGDFWIVADSRSHRGGKAWPEQTFGPAGSLCGNPEGATRTLQFEGSCFGGRSALASDDASSPATAEHVALVSLGEQITGADFAFSFDVVTRTADGESMQGSLRQFLLNAAAVPGPNRMRFVPLEYAPEQRDTTYGVPPQWWRIVAATPLPAITDDDTVVDGSAFNFVAAGSLLNTHPGRIGERATYKAGDRLDTRRLEKPEVEVVTAGERGIVCSARCGLRMVALHGSPTSVVVSADASLEHVVIGAGPDGLAIETPGTLGLHVESGTTQARHLLVTSQTSIGVLVAAEGRIDGEGLEVTRCGTPESGAAVVLFSSGSSIRGSNVSGNGGAGIVLGALDGSAPANGNSIESTTISANQAGVLIAPGSSRNAITRNDVIWNRFGGITVAPFQNAAPRENRFSANRFDENGLRPVVLDLQSDDGQQAENGRQAERERTARCERSAGLANDGIMPPSISRVELLRATNEARVLVRGHACPGVIVEIYQSHVGSAVVGEGSGPTQARDRGSVTPQERTRLIPSIGECNYLGATSALADGSFEIAFPLRVPVPLERARAGEIENDIWASDVLSVDDALARAFSALAIDTAGNTSELGERRGVDAVQSVDQQNAQVK